MAIGDLYASLEEFKSYRDIPASKTSLDEAMTDALASATAEIERHCDRQFNRQTTTTVRVYEPEDMRCVKVDDFWTTAGLVVETDPGGTGSFTTTFSSADYELFPLNGTVNGQPGWPFNEIKAVAGLYFPKYVTQPYRRVGVVRVTAQWGWAAVPAPVKQACLIMAAETFKLRDAPFGVAGSDQFGTILRVHDNRMAASKLARYCRTRYLVG